MATWAGIRNALHAFLAAATGLGDDHVLVADQDVKAPSGSFITFKLADVLPLGAADEMRQAFDGGAPVGQEITFTVQGVREFVVSVQAFTATTPGGDTDARALLGTVQLALALPTRKAALLAEGLTIFDRGTVRYMPAIAGAEFEGRAIVELRGYATLNLSESTTYVETVDVTDASFDDDLTVDFPIEL